MIGILKESLWKHFGASIDMLKNASSPLPYTLTEEKLDQPWIDHSKNMDLSLASSSSLNYSVLNILFYNMKHVQHHAAQLNLLLRQEIGKAPDYVSLAEDPL